MRVKFKPARIKLAALLGTFAMVIPLAAPAQAATEINVFIVSSPSAEALKALAPGFTAKTGTKVNFITAASSADLLTKLLLACTTKSSTNDVVQFDSGHVVALAGAGCLDLIGKRAVASKEYQDTRISQQLKQYGTYEGKRIGLPLSSEPYILWYRKDLYQKLNLRVPRTWAQYAANAKKCADAGYFGSAIPTGSNNAAFRVGSMLYNYGGAFYDPTTYEPMFNDSRTKAALKMALDLAYTTPASVINGGGLEAPAAFQQLDVCQMYLASGWWTTLADPVKSPKVWDKVAIADAPKMNGAKETFLFGWLIGLNEYSAKKKEGFEFIEYALGKTNASAFLEAGGPPTGRTLFGPALETLNSVAPYWKTHQAATKTAIPLPRIAEITEILNAIHPTINAIVTKQITLEAGITKMNADTRAIFVRTGKLKS